MGTVNETPQRFDFHVTQVVDPETACTRFAVQNGVVLGEDTFSNVSIFLPGEVVTVVCNEGFGVKSRSFVTSLEMTCGNDTWDGRVFKCSGINKEKIAKKEKEKEGDEEELVTIEDCYFVTSVGIGLLLLVVIMLSISGNIGKKYGD